MPIGSVRVSKADGSQGLDLQRDALAAALIEPSAIYHGRATGKGDARPALESCLKALRVGDTLWCGSWTAWDETFATWSTRCPP